jgi:CheY-like chemotaxis protein
VPHLFDEFYQVDRSLHRKHGGAGLGLAISKHFVEAHEGRIWVESRQGEGSTFSFTLPIPEQHIPLSRLRRSQPLVRRPSRDRPPLLVVDADPAVASLMARYLEAYQVIQVNAPEELVDAIARHRPQAMVWNAPPGENGSPPLLPAALQSPSIPLIQCSLPSQVWVERELQVAACLSKPVTAQRLLQTIHQLGDVRKVLIVDDDRNFCQLVERMLEASGDAFTVRSAYGGQDGLHLFRAWQPDLLLLDMIMPDLDGFQVLEEVRRDKDVALEKNDRSNRTVETRREFQAADVPIVLLTATSFAEDMLTQHHSQIVLRYPDGLTPIKTLRCLDAVLGTLASVSRDDLRSPDRALPALRDDAPAWAKRETRPANRLTGDC